jgi:hypothetical protein
VGNNGAGAYDTAISNADTRDHNHSCSQPNVAADDNVTFDLRLGAKSLTLFELVIGGRNEDLRSQGNKITDHDLSGGRAGPEIASFPDVALFSQRD